VRTNAFTRYSPDRSDLARSIPELSVLREDNELLTTAVLEPLDIGDALVALSEHLDVLVNCPSGFA